MRSLSPSARRCGGREDIVMFKKWWIGIALSLAPLALLALLGGG